MNNKNDIRHYADFHKNTKIGRSLPARALWPQEWNTVEYKIYPRLQEVSLPNPLELGNKLIDTITRRASRRSFSSHVKLAELSTLLKYSCGIKQKIAGKKSRAYASSGSRYPLEIYVFVAEGNKELASGIYHYNVRKHSLSYVNKTVLTSKTLERLFIVDNSDKTSIFIVTTAVFKRTINKYGDRGYRFILIETGEINQNLSLIAEALSLASCSVGKIGDSDSRIDELLDIDGATESYVHSVAIGRPVDKKD